MAGVPQTVPGSGLARCRDIGFASPAPLSVRRELANAVHWGYVSVAAFDAAIETLGFSDADLDPDHVERAGVLGGGVAEERPESTAAGAPAGGEAAWQRRRRGWASGEDDADALGFWEVDIDKLAHVR